MASFLRLLTAGLLLLPLLPSAVASDRIQVQVGACTLEAPARFRDDLYHLAQQAEHLFPKLEKDLGVAPIAPYRIVLIPPEPVDEELRQLDAAAPAWAAGFWISSRRIGAIRLSRVTRYPHDDMTSVLVHEVAHMLLHDATDGRLPRWFGEGVATWEGRRWGLRDLFVYSTGLLTHRLPPLLELDQMFRGSGPRARVGYAASFDFVGWTVRRYGRDVLPRILREARRRDFADAWKEATGTSFAAAEASWRRRSLLWYRWLPALLGTTPLWIAISLLTLVAAARRRARSREILARWGEEDVEPEDPGGSDGGLPPAGSGAIH